jgi:DNA-binding NtrC family response regulator
MNVLVVDDEPAILWTLAEILKSRGLTVITAPNARAARAVLCQQHCDVVITDMNMETREAGYEVAQMAVARSPKTVVIIISAYPLNSGWREHGAHAFLEKPFPPAVLLSTMQQLGVCGTTARPVNGDAHANTNPDEKPSTDKPHHPLNPGVQQCPLGQP